MQCGLVVVHNMAIINTACVLSIGVMLNRYMLDGCWCGVPCSPGTARTAMSVLWHTCCNVAVPVVLCSPASVHLPHSGLGSPAKSLSSGS